MPSLEYFETAFPTGASNGEGVAQDDIPLGVQACTQQAGDILVVPDNIGHVSRRVHWLALVCYLAFGIWHLAFGIWHLAFGI